MISKSIIVLTDAKSNMHVILAADKSISFAIVKFSTANTRLTMITNDPQSHCD